MSLHLKLGGLGSQKPAVARGGALVASRRFCAVEMSTEFVAFLWPLLKLANETSIFICIYACVCIMHNMCLHVSPYPSS